MIQFQHTSQANDPHDLQQLLLSRVRAEENEKLRQKMLTDDEIKTLELHEKHRDAVASAGRAVAVYLSLAGILLGSVGAISVVHGDVNPFMLLGVGGLSFAIGGLGGVNEWQERREEKKKLQIAERRLKAIAKAKKA